MASKLQTTIKLYLKDEEGNFTTKQFKSAEMLPGSVMGQYQQAVAWQK